MTLHEANSVCPSFKEYLKYWQAEVMPKMEEFNRHVANCPACQSLLFRFKDAFALSILQMSDEQLLNSLKGGAGEVDRKK